MPDVVKIGWSGGKDSSASCWLHLERGDCCKIVYYIPMFTPEIPLILKNHYDFIESTADLWRRKGAEVYRAEGMTYFDFVHKISSRGKNTGKPFGFPYFFTSRCNFKRDSKVASLSSLDVGNFDYLDLGIAADECDRNKLFAYRYGTYQYNMFNEPPKDDPRLRSILCELEMTEADAFELCRKNGILSPHYDEARMDGCALCPQAKEAERQRWYADYPEAVPILWELQEFVKKECPGHYPLRGYKMFLEGDIKNYVR